MLQGWERFFVRCLLVSDRFQKKIIRFVKPRPACLPLIRELAGGCPGAVQTQYQLGRNRENKVLLSIIIFQLLLNLSDALFLSEQ